MKIHGIKCKKCSSVIFSRACHDFRTCFCGLTGVDGGQADDYVRVLFDREIGYKNVTIDLNVTLKQLYEDWNNKTDQFGLIVSPRDSRKVILKKVIGLKY